MANTFTYKINNKKYINMTNKCNNNCVFCIRNTSDGLSGYYLWLDREPTVPEIIAELKDLKGIEEVVFCGFGEPLYRWQEVIEIAKYVKSTNTKTRINTNGQADLIAGCDIVPLLSPVIDCISISLNEVSAEDYVNICNPEAGEAAYYSLLDFAKRCKNQIKDVFLTVVDVIGEEKIKKAKEIAKSMGIKLRVRPYTKN